jgi:hypothetical protein
MRPDSPDDYAVPKLPIPSPVIIATGRHDFNDFPCFPWDLSLQSRLRWRHKHLQCQGEVGQYVPSVQEQARTYLDQADAAGKD